MCHCFAEAVPASRRIHCFCEAVAHVTEKRQPPRGEPERAADRSKGFADMRLRHTNRLRGGVYSYTTSTLAHFDLTTQ